MKKFQPSTTMHNPASKNSQILAAITSNKMSNVVNAGIFKQKAAMKQVAGKSPARKEATPAQPKPKALKLGAAPKTRVKTMGHPKKGV